MMAWCEVLGVRTAMRTELRRTATANRMSHTARTLSPSAKTCQDLPRCVSFSSAARQTVSCRNNEVHRERDSMSLIGFKLRRIGGPERTHPRSVASDLFLENQLESPSRSVTVCHIETGAGGGTGRHPRRSMPGWKMGLKSRLAVGKLGGRRRPAPNRALGDNFAAGAHGTGTFGDSRRQNLSLRTGPVSGVLQATRPPVIAGERPKGTTRERLMAMRKPTEIRPTHVCRLIGSGSQGWKGSETTTKNDNMQKPGRSHSWAAPFKGAHDADRSAWSSGRGVRMEGRTREPCSCLVEDFKNRSVDCHDRE